jgi:hypothetical protein
VRASPSSSFRKGKEEQSEEYGGVVTLVQLRLVEARKFAETLFRRMGRSVRDAVADINRMVAR